MKKEEKTQFIDSLAAQLQSAGSFYLTDTSTLNASTTSRLRRACFKRNVKLRVVKNTLLRKAMEKSGKSLEEFYPILKGTTSIMFSEVSNDPARLIKEFRRTSPKPILKGAFIEETIYLGDDQLDILVNVKSRVELIGDLVGLLQSPAKNVISALQSGGGKLAGIVKTLSEKAA
ncbi:MAG: 50S ribosomal protein L10 [Bacteroidales bacterium]|nr:50S ribosomal protein L10 [Bacteroidales bacterium]MDD4602837.1 50S ribosomal protein L10 [Bacteroidales bacterium]